MIRFGTLGAAQITPAALVYPCMNEPGARITAIAARNRAGARAFAEAHHIREVCDDYEAVINHPSVDAIYNPLPIAAHHPWTLKALAAGKPVLCEKSLACNTREAAEMNEAAKQAGLVLMDAFHYRYHPLFTRVKAIYDSGILGDIKRINAAFHVPVRGADNIRLAYELGGGVTMDIGCYPIHWVRHLTGAEPMVKSARAIVGPPHVDLMLTASMKLDDIQINIEGDMRETASFRASLEVTGDRGTLAVNNPVAPQLGHQLVLTVGGKTRFETLDRRPSYAYQLDAFISAVQSGTPLPTDGDDAVRQMALVDRCYEAAGLPPRGLELD